MELPSPRAALFSCPSLRRTRRDNAWSPRPRSGRKPNGRAAEPPPEPSPGHVPRCERAISPTYAAKPGLTCTAACRFLCRTASDQARRASGRWPKGASEPPASFRGAGRPELCQSRFNSPGPIWRCVPRRRQSANWDYASPILGKERRARSKAAEDCQTDVFAAHRMAKPCGRALPSRRKGGLDANRLP